MIFASKQILLETFAHRGAGHSISGQAHAVVFQRLLRPECPTVERSWAFWSQPSGRLFQRVIALPTGPHSARRQRWREKLRCILPSTRYSALSLSHKYVFVRKKFGYYFDLVSILPDNKYLYKIACSIREGSVVETNKKPLSRRAKNWSVFLFWFSIFFFVFFTSYISLVYGVFLIMVPILFYVFWIYQNDISVFPSALVIWFKNTTFYDILWTQVNLSAQSKKYNKFVGLQYCKIGLPTSRHFGILLFCICLQSYFLGFLSPVLDISDMTKEESVFVGKITVASGRGRDPYQPAYRFKRNDGSLVQFVPSPSSDIAKELKRGKHLIKGKHYTIWLQPQCGLPVCKKEMPEIKQIKGDSFEYLYNKEKIEKNFSEMRFVFIFIFIFFSLLPLLFAYMGGRAFKKSGENGDDL